MAAPSAPVLSSVSRTATGTAQATVTGEGTIYLKYRKLNATSWTTAENTYSGGPTGTIDVTGLDSTNYEFLAVSKSSDDYWSLPSLTARCFVGPDSDDPVASDIETNIQADISNIILAGPGSRELTYYESDHTAHTIRALVDRSRFVPEPWEDGSGVTKRASLLISKSSADGIEEPAHNDYVRFAGKTWRIESIDEASDIPGMHEVIVYTRERLKMSHPGFSTREY